MDCAEGFQSDRVDRLFTSHKDEPADSLSRLAARLIGRPFKLMVLSREEILLRKEIQLREETHINMDNNYQPANLLARAERNGRPINVYVSVTETDLASADRAKPFILIFDHPQLNHMGTGSLPRTRCDLMGRARDTQTDLRRRPLSFA